MGDNLVYTDWKKDNYLKALKDLIGNAKSVGVEYDHLNLQMAQRFKENLDLKSMEDVSQLAMKMRMIKSQEEFEFYRKSARIADLGGFEVRKWIQEGVSEHLIATKGTEAMVHEIATSFPNTEIRDSWIWLQSGAQNTDGAHNPLTTR